MEPADCGSDVVDAPLARIRSLHLPTPNAAKPGFRQTWSVLGHTPKARNLYMILWLPGSLQDHHLPGLDEASRLDAIEVDAAGHVVPRSPP